MFPKQEGSNKCVCVVCLSLQVLTFSFCFYVYHLMCDFTCQLCKENCSQIHHILLLTLNFLVRLITEYFHVIFSLGI